MARSIRGNIYFAISKNHCKMFVAKNTYSWGIQGAIMGWYCKGAVCSILEYDYCVNSPVIAKRIVVLTF